MKLVNLSKTKKIKKFLATTIISIGIATVVWPLTSSAQRAYTMICKGGGSMNGLYEFNAASGELTINFQRADAATNNPPAGNCSWVDRRISPQEPAVLKYQTNNLTAINNLINSVQSGKLFYVQCYNNRQGQMVITRLGL
jgi:hypothetical protein